MLPSDEQTSEALIVTVGMKMVWWANYGAGPQVATPEMLWARFGCYVYHYSVSHAVSSVK